MTKFDKGLYQSFLTRSLVKRLQSLDARLSIKKSNLHTAEAADRIALHLAKVIQKAIDSLDDDVRVEEGAQLTQKLIQVLVDATSAQELIEEQFDLPPRMLKAVESRHPDGTVDQLVSPLIDLLDTTLLTNAPGEPRIGNQIITEIPSADQIDLVMAFIRKSGIAPMLGALRLHCEAGKSLRILTTTYTGSTEALALDLLAKIGAEVKVSYDVSTTRLHAKAWLFNRKSGFSTAYVGSSNLTHSAQVNGLEWNARFSGSRNPDVLAKVEAVFESYWNSGDFVPYDRVQFDELNQSVASSPKIYLSPIEIRPEPFQERLLEQLDLSRQQGHHRNLLVSATGTGKTVMAAIDFGRLMEKLPRSRLLFIAHRKEILEQSLATFRHALRDHQFGEIWVDGKRPQAFENVFASVQSMNATGLANIERDHFDVVIVDEFHHAAAATYKKILDHLSPVELLGLTATPERADDLSVLDYFGGRIAAELRLWDAIERSRLVPFAYYGIHDGQDLSQIPFKRGTGYDTMALTNVLTGSDAWARLVIHEVTRKIAEPGQMRALGFCVGVSHARFMAKQFNSAGIKSLAIWSDTDAKDRREALQLLAEKKINVLFSVDLFNEGVDVPSVDTLLMLRPTESPTLFLQQLGRGLRRHRDKSICTVLDFVGRQHQDFRFDLKFRSLLGGTRTRLTEQVANNFPYLPAGCHMELDRVASAIVLESIKQSVPDKWTAKVRELKALVGKVQSVSLADYLKETGLDLEDIYSGGRCWSELCRAAGLETFQEGPNEKSLSRAVGRLLHVDDAERLSTYKRLVGSSVAPDVDGLPTRDLRYLRMLTATLVDQLVDKNTRMHDCLAIVWAHPQVRAELVEVFDLLQSRVTHLVKPIENLPSVPLSVHARYSRIEILAAFGIGKSITTPPWQSGVYWSEEVQCDLMAFTLDKSTGHFSPTTRYQDYAISRDLIHWESQSITRADSKTGQRYQNHRKEGSKIMLFSRTSADERSFYFLGGANYVSHQSEMPMAIKWKLDYSLPGDLYATFAAAVA